MKVFYAPRTRSSRVVWMLEEVSVAYELEHCDIRSPERKDSRAFRQASPMGKVPAIQDGAVSMSESAAICLYVADRYGRGEFAPTPDSSERGAFLYWMFFAPAVIEPTMAEKVGNIEPNPQRNGWGSFDLMVDTLAAGLDGRDWLMGDRFTAADVMVGSSAAFMHQFGLLPDVRVLSDYIDRCASRPAYRKAMSLDNA